MDEFIFNELINLNTNMHNRIENPVSIQFHLHQTYEVLFFISGNASYFVNNNCYPLKYGDIILTNTTEIHAPVFYSRETYERIILHFSPQMLKHISTPGFNLERCFIERPNGKDNKTTLKDSQITRFLDLYKTVQYLNDALVNENVILKLSKLMEILVFINDVFLNDTSGRSPSIIPVQLGNIINYINHNLSGDLSLEALGKMFYMNKNYLCTLFNRYTGKTLHQYIIYRRISYAKQLLTKGYNVTETCSLCGFNDYSNFVKTFGQIVGDTPGRYWKRIGKTGKS